MTTPSSIIVNGTLGKFLAAVVVILLATGVVGIWQMNGTLNRLVVSVEFIKAEQVEMDTKVEKNTDRIHRLQLTEPFVLEP